MLELQLPVLRHPLLARVDAEDLAGDAQALAERLGELGELVERRAGLLAADLDARDEQADLGLRERVRDRRDASLSAAADVVRDRRGDHEPDLGLLQRAQPLVQEPLVVRLAVAGRGLALGQLGEVRPGDADLVLLDRPGHREDRALVPALQQGELLGVAPLQHAEQVAAELAQPLHEVLGPAQHEREAVVRDRHRCAPAAAAASTSGPDATAAHQGRRVDRRLEQRQRPADAEDVLRLPDLAQPVLHPGPVVAQLRCSRGRRSTAPSSGGAALACGAVDAASTAAAQRACRTRPARGGAARSTRRRAAAAEPSWRGRSPSRS